MNPVADIAAGIMRMSRAHAGALKKIRSAHTRTVTPSPIQPDLFLRCISASPDFLVNPQKEIERRAKDMAKLAVGILKVSLSA